MAIARIRAEQFNLLADIEGRQIYITVYYLRRRKEIYKILFMPRDRAEIITTPLHVLMKQHFNIDHVIRQKIKRKEACSLSTYYFQRYWESVHNRRLTAQETESTDWKYVAP